MKGRKPVPTALKLVKGNPGRRRLPKHEPKPRRIIPSPPAHINPAALQSWGSLSARLDRLRLMTELDDFALEQLTENYVEIIELRADIRAKGRTMIVTTENGEVERSRPSWTQLADAERRFRAMMTEFGLTPSSRARVSTVPDENGNTDPAAAYFG